MQQRRLGKNGPLVSSIGLGCMSMSEFYGTPDEKESIETVHKALDLGITFFDTADVYGPSTNERLVGKALGTRRKDIVLATKFGVVRNDSGAFLGVNGHPDYVRKCCEASLERLRTDYIDLYYQHRVDPDVPIEETVGAMADLICEGKVRHLGLSEAARTTIRRACAEYPISALQTEFSLWSRDPETELLSVTRELGITFVAYGPLGRGFLSGAIKTVDDLEDDDWRKKNPRFQGDNFEKNIVLAEKLQEIAERKGVTSAQLALTWVMAQGEDIVAIPGTRRRKHLEENCDALDLVLTSAELEALDEACPLGAAAGDRYGDMSGVNL